jgi:hypothetical protein
MMPKAMAESLANPVYCSCSKYVCGKYFMPNTYG